jgi:hypothetical protein
MAIFFNNLKTFLAFKIESDSNPSKAHVTQHPPMH